MRENPALREQAVAWMDSGLLGAVGCIAWS
jgi:hypothetical protein